MPKSAGHTVKTRGTTPRKPFVCSTRGVEGRFVGNPTCSKGTFEIYIQLVPPTSCSPYIWFMYRSGCFAIFSRAIDNKSFLLPKVIAPTGQASAHAGMPPFLTLL